jgi:hypothetical protein
MAISGEQGEVSGRPYPDLDEPANLHRDRRCCEKLGRPSAWGVDQVVGGEAIVGSLNDHPIRCGAPSADGCAEVKFRTVNRSESKVRRHGCFWADDPLTVVDKRQAGQRRSQGGPAARDLRGRQHLVRLPQLFGNALRCPQLLAVFWSDNHGVTWGEQLGATIAFQPLPQRVRFLREGHMRWIAEVGQSNRARFAMARAVVVRRPVTLQAYDPATSTSKTRGSGAAHAAKTDHDDCGRGHSLTFHSPRLVDAVIARAGTPGLCAPGQAHVGGLRIPMVCRQYI